MMCCYFVAPLSTVLLLTLSVFLSLSLFFLSSSSFSAAASKKLATNKKMEIFGNFDFFLGKQEESRKDEEAWVLSLNHFGNVTSLSLDLF